MNEQRGSGVLIAIALFKLVKAILLIALGVGAFSLLFEHDTVRTLRTTLGELGMNPRQPLISKAIAKVSGLDHRRLEEVGVGTFIYAIVFLVEGTGLLLRRRWAEYLTVVVTASFIPFELYELVHEASALKVVGLVVNVLIVVYLVLRLLHERREKRVQHA
ncbi:MAG TPA: DUF2127 domain-containing protein [Polyangiaceae bacterium]|nr:DUF2127 domain-containing protein [Polyangiaceae bacterium]